MAKLHSSDKLGNRRFSLIGLAALFFCWVAAASPSPGLLQTALEDGIEKESDDGLTDAIRQGLKDSTCLKELQTSEDEYNAQLTSVKELSETRELAKKNGDKTAKLNELSKKIREGETELAARRKAYLLKVQACGPCRTHPVENQPRSISGYWYYTDGSCLMTYSNETTAVEAFERMASSLRKPADYLKFTHIVRAEIVDPSLDKFDTSGKDLPDDFYAFLEIRTPFAILSGIPSFFYFIENRIETGATATADKKFVLSFHTPSLRDEDKWKGLTDDQKRTKEDEERKKRAALTSDYTKQSTQWTSPGGNVYQTIPVELVSVKGLWVLSQKGNETSARYATFGDFFGKKDSIGKVATDVLLEALLEMHKRGTQTGTGRTP